MFLVSSDRFRQMVYTQNTEDFIKIDGRDDTTLGTLITLLAKIAEQHPEMLEKPVRIIYDDEEQAFDVPIDSAIMMSDEEYEKVLCLY